MDLLILTDIVCQILHARSIACSQFRLLNIKDLICQFVSFLGSVFIPDICV